MVRPVPALLSTAVLVFGVLAQIPDQFTTGFDNKTISLVVTYGAHEVVEGERLGLDAVGSAPSLALGDSSSLNTNSRYIVIMIDPDAPSRANPTSANILHWVKTDLRIRSSTATNITADNTTSALSYAPPRPPEGSGPHRYIFLLYDQPKRSGFQVSGLPESRARFNVSEWRISNGLGAASAGTYFLAEFGVNSSSPSANASASATGGSGSPTETRNGASQTTAAGGGGSGGGGGSSSNAGRIAVGGCGTIMLCWLTGALLGGLFMGM